MIEPKGKVQVSLGLTPEQVERLDAIAKHARSSRNAAAREVFARGLAALESELGIKPRR